MPKKKPEDIVRVPELVELDTLRPHPRNYRDHPEDQVAHLVKSLEDHGVYKNVVATRDGILLAGHGIVQAAREMGLKQFPVVKLDVDENDPEALKILIGDNESGRLALPDDRALTEMLKELYEMDPLQLLGTGFDEKTLAGLAMITRTADELKDHDAAAEWLGMPEYKESEGVWHIVVTTRTEAEREAFIKHAELTGTIKKMRDDREWHVWWPPKERDDLSAAIHTDAEVAT